MVTLQYNNNNKLLPNVLTTYCWSFLKEFNESDLLATENYFWKTNLSDVKQMKGYLNSFPW